MILIVCFHYLEVVISLAVITMVHYCFCLHFFWRLFIVLEDLTLDGKLKKESNLKEHLFIFGKSCFSVKMFMYQDILTSVQP